MNEIYACMQQYSLTCETIKYITIMLTYIILSMKMSS